MPSPRKRSRGVETVVATLAACAMCAAVWLLDHGTERRAPPRPAAAAGFGDGATGTSGGRHPAPRPGGEPGSHGPPRSSAAASAPYGLPAAGERPGRALSPLPDSSTPVRVRAPAVDIDAPLMRLGLDEDGSLEPPPPEREEVAGWYAGGTVPGATGTALLAGHVDNADGPAVFYGLGALRKGDTVEVDRRDGLTGVFTVGAVEVYEGDDFPDEKVYGQADRPELRLITCGGTFDRKRGRYLGNVVVFARLTGVERTGSSAD